MFVRLRKGGSRVCFVTPVVCVAALLSLAGCKSKDDSGLTQTQLTAGASGSGPAATTKPTESVQLPANARAGTYVQPGTGN